MRVRTEYRVAGQRSDTLMVLLPPALADIDDFATQGFVDAWRNSQLGADLLLADLSGQYVLDGTAVHALHTYVLQPAQDLGYQSVWLVGISLGAYSALLYAAEHATRLGALLGGLYLLSPYPGTHETLVQIRNAGGPMTWSVHHPSSDDERGWWHWLVQQAYQDQWPTPVYFGTGLSDRFVRGQSLIADLLPAQRVRWVAGGHEWATWKTLWEEWLSHGPWQAKVEAVAGEGRRRRRIQ